MACIGCNTLNAQSVNQEINQASVGGGGSFMGEDNIPSLKGFAFPITITKDQAQRKKLKPGFYEIHGRIEGSEAGQIRDENFIVDVPVDGIEYPVKVLEFETSENYEYDGFQGVDYKAVIDVNETPVNSAVPVVPIIWGASAIGSLVAGSVFVDRVDKFVTSGAGFVVSLASLAILGYSVFYKK
jgi:hypothetical protein